MKRDTDLAETTEERLRREIEDLKQRLHEQQGRGASHAGPSVRPWHPSGITIACIFLGAAVLIVVAFFAGYTPLQKRQTLIRGEASEQGLALPRVEVIEIGRSSRTSELELPGSIQAITEAPILARADGYIKRRMVDIGDRVQAGQPVAEIDAPEMDQQIRQAQAAHDQTKAALDQAKAANEQAKAVLEQALANYEQGKSNLELARVTAERSSNLANQGIFSRQEDDQARAQYQAQTAGVQALEKAIAAQRSNVAAAEASVTAAEANMAAAEANGARLNEIQAYRVVKAPFTGVITLRNVDVGALVNLGTTLLFRVAQTDTLRTFVNVSQANASSVRVGQPARLSVSSLPGRQFAGTVARTANALDPTNRTLLVEVEVPNASGALLPGMYAEVDLSSARANPPLLIPGDALIARAEGTQVAVVRPDHTVHLQKIVVGRDLGAQLEVLNGIQAGDTIIANPGDAAREGAKVEPVAVRNPSITEGVKRKPQRDRTRSDADVHRLGATAP
jgi:RND family efflux transporter MFP subunit